MCIRIWRWCSGSLTRSEHQVSPGIPGFRRPVNGHALNASSTWYSNLSLGNTSSLNEWFWGAECGPERDPTGRHKYLEDAVSVNTGEAAAVMIDTTTTAAAAADIFLFLPARSGRLPFLESPHVSPGVAARRKRVSAVVSKMVSLDIAS